MQNIKQQVKAVIEYSQDFDCDEAVIDELIDKWYQKKKYFITLFGGSPIFEVPEEVEFTLDEKGRNERASEFATRIQETYLNYDLANFIDRNTDSFFDNVVSDNCGHPEIPIGMKLVRSFKYFEDDKKTLEVIQNLASCYIQENKVRGKLCLSVHPLDFLSSSENTYNWRSCHALDGEYRTGNLSYMLDECTVMVYLKGENDVILPHFPSYIPWNNKKWRVLLHINPGNTLIFAGRQYPFSSKQGLDIALEWYNELRRQAAPFCNYGITFDKWKQDYITEYNGEELRDYYLPVYCGIYAKSDLVKDEKSPDKELYHYNDVLKSTCYTKPYYTCRSNSRFFGFSKDEQQLKIGCGSIKCLHCGNKHIYNSETFLCGDCYLEFGDIEDNDDIAVCDCCGTHIWYDDAITLYDGDYYVCERCYNNQCFTCSCCGDSYYSTDERYSRKRGIYCCRWCFEALDDNEEEE